MTILFKLLIVFSLGLLGIGSGFRLFGLAYWNLLALLCLPLFYSIYIKYFLLSLPILSFLFILSVFDFEIAFDVFRHVIVSIPFICLPVLLRKYNKINISSKSSNAIHITSAIIIIWCLLDLIGLIQVIPGLPASLGWYLHSIVNENIVLSDVAGLGKGTASLFLYAIPFSYFLTMQIIILYSWYIKSSLRYYFDSKVVSAWSLILFLTLILCERRSAQLCLLFALVFAFFKPSVSAIRRLKMSKYLAFFLAFLIFIGSFGFTYSTSFSTRQRAFLDGSTSEHILLFPAGFVDILTDPFNLEDHTDSYRFLYGNHSPSLQKIKNLAPHNGLTTLKRKYTILGLFLCLLTLYLYYRPFTAYSLTVITLYLSNSLLHNNFLFIQDPFGFVAFSFAFLL